MHIARRLGAVTLLAIGAIHLQQYIAENVAAYPTVAILFLLNVIGSGIVGIALLAPLGRLLSQRSARAAEAVLAGTALLIAAGSLIFLFISESSSLFGFTESGYRTPVVLAIIAEGVTVLLLAPVFATSLAGALNRPPGSPSEQRSSHGRNAIALRPGH
jgi:hypothetical protein